MGSARARRAWSHCGADRVRSLASDTSHALEVTMKTQGEIEASICQGMSHFELEYMCRGPKDIRTHLIDDLVVVRLQADLTAVEEQAGKTTTAGKGRALLKQVRTHRLET